MDEDRRIAPVEDLPEEGTFLVTLRDRDDEEEVEAILLRTDGGVVAWLNYCQHWTDVRLDRGSGATVRNGEILCTKHGATFETESGYCDFGPCEGAYLTEVEVAVVDGHVSLTDESYEFVETGATNGDPIEDLSSSGDRLGF